MKKEIKNIINKVLKESEKEEDFIFELEKLNIKYNRHLDIHRDLLNSILDGTLSIEEALKIIKEKEAFKNKNRYKK
ncbi:hypothetical protein QNI23_016635 [Bermanella sp. WJH001]|uniref:hypothetical protein n=1 Tax=Bermanella sp. WJH001 TaxID=3048005 RepID=UPI0024BD8DE4|nr:hypothetical protein [Bermanella sp. WJH001]MDJ1538929.1 hypothetical protein [Bermanella sp. WJH001]